MPYLLDTNIVSDLVKNPQGQVAQRLSTLGAGEVYTSVIVAAELRYGAIKKASPRLQAQLDAILAVLPVLPVAPPADQHYARLRGELEQAGQPIGGNDLLIAAHALALGYTLVSDNEREFSRVRGLTTTNWLR